MMVIAWSIGHFNTPFPHQKIFIALNISLAIFPSFGYDVLNINIVDSDENVLRNIR